MTIQKNLSLLGLPLNSSRTRSPDARVDDPARAFDPRSGALGTTGKGPKRSDGGQPIRTQDPSGEALGLAGGGAGTDEAAGGAGGMGGMGGMGSGFSGRPHGAGGVPVSLRTR